MMSASDDSGALSRVSLRTSQRHVLGGTRWGHLHASNHSPVDRECRGEFSLVAAEGGRALPDPGEADGPRAWAGGVLVSPGGDVAAVAEGTWGASLGTDDRSLKPMAPTTGS